MSSAPTHRTKALNGPHSFEHNIQRLHSALADLPEDAPLADGVELLKGLAQFELEAGVSGGIERLQLSFDIATELPEPDRRRQTLHAAYLLGVAHLRLPQPVGSHQQSRASTHAHSASR